MIRERGHIPASSKDLSSKIHYNEWNRVGGGDDDDDSV